MATIKINDLYTIKGKVSFSHYAEYDKDFEQWEDGGIKGQLVTHQYFDEIYQIETDRYIIKGCSVVEEAFGSDDFNIAYTFIANECEVKKDPLTQEEIDSIESKAYEYETADKFLYGLSNKEE